MTPDGFHEYIYRATVDRTVDGDTVDLRLNLGMDMVRSERVRLFGIDAPERRGSTKAAGEDAYWHLRALLAEHCGPGGYFRIQTYQDKKGKYGRYLACIWGWEFKDGDYGDLVCINRRMITDGHAVERYYGSKHRLPDD